jgi:branched-chain amino acid transport system permease protein
MLRLINFAHGDFITIGAFGLIVPSRNDMAIMAIGSLPVVLLVPAACAIVVIAALLSDRLVSRPLRTASAPTLMVASFSVGYIIQNTILMTYGARPKTIDLWRGWPPKNGAVHRRFFLQINTDHVFGTHSG